LDGKTGHDAYAAIRETIRSLDQVAIGRVVLTNRELRPVSVKSMGDEDADAQYYKECCNNFEHRQPSQNNNLGFNAMP
jgi:hypothetical protein